MDILTKAEATRLGLKKYFTGKPCKQGHIAERYVLKSTCTECLIESRAKRIDAIREHNRKAYHSMSEEKKQSERKRLREYNRKRYWDDPEKFRKRALEHQKKHREKHLERLERWKAENEEWIKQYRQLPEVKQKGRFFASRRRSVKLSAMPAWCNEEELIDFYKKTPKGFHVDHIVPLISNIVCGLHSIENLRYLPAKENMAKGNRYWPDMP